MFCNNCLNTVVLIPVIKLKRERVSNTSQSFALVVLRGSGRFWVYLTFVHSVSRPFSYIIESFFLLNFKFIYLFIYLREREHPHEPSRPPQLGGGGGADWVAQSVKPLEFGSCIDLMVVRFGSALGVECV